MIHEFLHRFINILDPNRLSYLCEPSFFTEIDLGSERASQISAAKGAQGLNHYISHFKSPAHMYHVTLSGPECSFRTPQLTTLRILSNDTLELVIQHPVRWMELKFPLIIFRVPIRPVFFSQHHSIAQLGLLHHIDQTHPRPSDVWE